MKACVFFSIYDEIVEEVISVSLFYEVFLDF